MHEWGDKEVDWVGIDDAAEYIGVFCRRWARLGGQAKEKYGTVRFYVNFGRVSLHTLVYPGYVYNQFPNWLWSLDCKYIGPTLRFVFGKISFKWQKYIYRKAYFNAIKKWPHLREEILCCADYKEYIFLDRIISLDRGLKQEGTIDNGSFEKYIEEK